MDHHRKDSIELARGLYRAGKIDRRSFLGLCAMLGAGTALAGLPGRARAATEEITISNFGGDAVKAYTEAWCAPFEADSGIAVAIDGAGPLPGNIKKQVDQMMGRIRSSRSFGT